MPSPKPTTIDEYIAGFSEPAQTALREIRDVIREVVPDAEEAISYDMAAFRFNGKYLIYFGGWKKHAALYPVNQRLLDKAGEAAAGYKGTSNSIHFPWDKPMPLDLIRKITTLLWEDRLATNKYYFRRPQE